MSLDEQLIISIDDFDEQLKQCFIAIISKWNREKIQQFEDYFGDSFKDYFSKHSQEQRTAQKTKLISPAFTNELNKCLKENLGGEFNITQKDGEDIQVLINDEWTSFEQKITTQPESSRGGYWTGNHVSNKVNRHILMRLIFSETGEITNFFLGILLLQDCETTKWKKAGGNRANLAIKATDAKHLKVLIGKSEPTSKRSDALLKYVYVDDEEE